MNVAKVIASVKSKGIKLSINGNRLHYEADEITDTEIAFLRNHKKTILAYLRDRDLSIDESDAIRKWLSFIGETDPEMINAVLEQCKRDQEALDYFLNRASETPPVEMVDS